MHGSLVYGEQQEDRDSGEANRVGLESEAQWHGGKSRVAAIVLQVPPSGTLVGRSESKVMMDCFRFEVRHVRTHFVSPNARGPRIRLGESKSSEERTMDLRVRSGS